MCISIHAHLYTWTCTSFTHTHMNNLFFSVIVSNRNDGKYVKWAIIICSPALGQIVIYFVRILWNLESRGRKFLRFWVHHKLLQKQYWCLLGPVGKYLATLLIWMAWNCVHSQLWWCFHTMSFSFYLICKWDCLCQKIKMSIHRDINGNKTDKPRISDRKHTQ